MKPDKSLADLIDHVVPGRSMEQAFYCSDTVYDADIRQIFMKKWLLVDHVSRIPEKGQYFTYEIGDESIIVIREDATRVNAFFNVCRHRGSRICLEEAGKVPRLTCPYHAWTYGLDGALKAARLMGEDFDPAENGLHRCHLRVWHGLIFINLSDGDAPDFDAVYEDLDPFLEYHGLAQAKIAHKQSYPTTANWKLVVENFLECYHCMPSHAEFCSLQLPEALVAMGAGPSSGPTEAVEAFRPILKAWETRAAELGRPLGTVDDGPESSHLRLLVQRPLKDGLLSETEDGKPVAPPMGNRQDFDGGRMYVGFAPFNQLIAISDFAVLFRFTPRGPSRTDIDLTWLVAESAGDVDIDKMIWGWDVTTCQDKIITENNQAGIRSSRYRPGVYSEQERRVVTYIDWYLRQLQQ